MKVRSMNDPVRSSEVFLEVRYESSQPDGLTGLPTAEVYLAWSYGERCKALEESPSAEETGDVWRQLDTCPYLIHHSDNLHQRLLPADKSRLAYLSELDSCFQYRHFMTSQGARDRGG